MPVIVLFYPCLCPYPLASHRPDAAGMRVWADEVPVDRPDSSAPGRYWEDCRQARLRRVETFHWPVDYSECRSTGCGAASVLQVVADLQAACSAENPAVLEKTVPDAHSVPGVVRAVPVFVRRG